MQKDAADAIEHDLSFNPYLGPNNASAESSTRAHAVIGVPLLAVKEHDRKRAFAGKNLDTFYKVMIAVVSNLIVHYLRDSPGNGVPVPLSKKCSVRRATATIRFRFLAHSPDAEGPQKPWVR